MPLSWDNKLEVKSLWAKIKQQIKRAITYGWVAGGVRIGDKDDEGS